MDRMSRKKAESQKEAQKDLAIIPNTDHPHAPYYQDTEHYYINREGCLCYANGDKRYILANGSAIITKERKKYDGSGESEIEFTVEVITQNRKRIKIQVSASRFISLNWFTEKCGTACVILGNQNAKQLLSTGILLSGKNCEREKVFTHTGYQEENGKPTNYNSASGPLLPSSDKCELDPGLSRYSLSSPSETEADKIAGVKADIGLLYAHEPEVTSVLFAEAFLAPLLPIIKGIAGDTSLLVFLNGKTQSGKSQIASLFMSLFGRFDSQTPPTTFASTANAISAMAYILKDSVLWIDDYHPQETDMKRQNQIFQNLVRMAGDHSNRRRLDSNAKLKEALPPRCLFLVTGEFPPKIGQSGHARVFQVDVPYSRKDITLLRKQAREGILSRGMADYITYVISNYEKVSETARKKYEDLLSDTNNLFGECRLSNQATLLCLSAYMFFDYAVRIKALTYKEAEELYRFIENGITNNARKKEEQLRQEDPCELYVNAIRDLLSSGRSKVIDLDQKDLPDYPYASLDLGPDREGFIGWKDSRGYYLNTNASYSAVTAYYSRQDMSFVTNPNTLWRQLRDSKLLIPDKKNTPCQLKKIGKEVRRVLWFPRTVFDIPEEI